MYVEVPAGAVPHRDRRLLLTARAPAAVPVPGRAGGAAAQGARRSRPAAADVPRRLARRRRGVRLRSQRRLRPVAAHDQPSPQGAARRRAARAREARGVGLLPRPHRGAFESRRADRRSCTVNAAVVRRALAEFLGTAVLVAAVVGSGVMAVRLSPDLGVQLLINALATVAALGVLICVLGPVSGAHFNPAVTLVALARRELGAAEGGRYVAAQLLGALAGAALGNLMFGMG